MSKTTPWKTGLLCLLTCAHVGCSEENAVENTSAEASPRSEAASEALRAHPATYRGVLVHDTPIIAQVVVAGDERNQDDAGVRIRRGPWRVSSDDTHLAGVEAHFNPLRPRTASASRRVNGLTLEAGEVAMLAVIDTRYGSGLGVGMGDDLASTTFHSCDGSGRSCHEECPPGEVCSEHYYRGWTDTERERSIDDQDCGTLWALLAVPRDEQTRVAVSSPCLDDEQCQASNLARTFLDGQMTDPAGERWAGTVAEYEADPSSVPEAMSGYLHILSVLGMERGYGAKAFHGPTRFPSSDWVVGWLPLDRLRLSAQSSCTAGELVSTSALRALSDKIAAAQYKSKPEAGVCPEDGERLFDNPQVYGAILEGVAVLVDGASYDVASDGEMVDAQGQSCPGTKDLEPSFERWESLWAEIQAGDGSAYSPAFFQSPLFCQ